MRNDTITKVELMAEQLGFGELEDFQDEGKLFAEQDISELQQFAKAFKSENGLIPNAAVPGILQCSKQNWYNIRGNYNFKMWNIYGKDWFSRNQLEEFYKIRRAQGVQGRGRVSLKEVWNEAQGSDS